MPDKLTYEILNDKVSLNLSLTAPFYAPSRIQEFNDVLGTERRISTHTHTCTSFLSDYYRSIFGWIPANPSKPDIVDAIKAVYIEPLAEVICRGEFALE